MYADARKIHLIEAIIKTEDEGLIAAVEKSIEANVELHAAGKISFSDLAGSISNDDAAAMQLAIDQDCENIDRDGWI